MATNIEILGINASEIHNKTYLQAVNNDAEIIVKEILLDIFDTAIKKSEETQRNKTDIEAETGDLIDLTRNYKQEFKTILQNLKCQSHKSQPSSNASLEDQIRKVIEEIKSLESSVRLNINQEDRGDMTEENYTASNSNPVELKYEITDFLKQEEEEINSYFNEEYFNETVLQVIDFQSEDNDVCFPERFPTEEELEDVNLTNELNQGDQPQAQMFNNTLENIEKSAGETVVPNPVPNPEPDEKLLQPEDGTIRKKKSLGRRLWHFIRKTSRSTSRNQIENSQ